ncbi:MAG TPA: GtrA family protein [Polyangia bacterium]|nr:GtrA family protein [Polyangia bacterium]
MEAPREVIPSAAAPSGWRQLARHHAASIVATAVDYLVMVACVELAHLDAVAATAIGAFSGAVVNFILGRRMIYKTADLPASHQVWRYGLVSLASLGLNTGGEYLFHVMLRIEYLLARLITSVIVSNAWNYPMQRYFVFARPREQA